MVPYHTDMKHTFHPKHKIKNTHVVDSLALIVGVVQPVATLPQIWLVYSAQDATGVSVLMWTFYNIGSLVLLTYGIRHKLVPIIVAQVLWLIVQTPMMLAVFIFG